MTSSDSDRVPADAASADRAASTGGALSTDGAPSTDGAASAERRDVVLALAYDGVTPLRRIGYPLYLVALFSAIYGTTVSHALFRYAAESGLRDRLGLWPVPLAVVGALAMVGAAYVIGHTRGPVQADLGLIDLVLSTDIDRATVLLPWWRAVLVTTVAAGAILGVAVGGGSTAAGAGPAATPLAGTLIGALLGWLLVHAWLRGQVHDSASGNDSADEHGYEDADGDGAGAAGRRSGSTAALSRLRLPELRRHAVLGRALTAMMYAGDAAHLRRAVPVKARRRGLVLRPRGRWVTVLTADVLMLRRAPTPSLTGLALVVVGTAGAAWSAGQHDDRVALALGPALAVLGVGAGLLSRGLRGVADLTASPALLGIGVRAVVLPHLLVGVVPVAVAWAVLSPWLVGDLPTAVAVGAGAVAVVSGTQLLATFAGAVRPSRSPQGLGPALVLGLVAPHAVALVSGLAAGAVVAYGSPLSLAAAAGLPAVVVGVSSLLEATRPQG